MWSNVVACFHFVVFSYTKNAGWSFAFQLDAVLEVLVDVENVVVNCYCCLRRHSVLAATLRVDVVMIVVSFHGDRLVKIIEEFCMMPHLS